MKMRFLLTMVCVSALMSKAHAQWTDQFQAVDSVNAKGNTVTTIAASGEVLVAGVFNQEFSFGSYDLEPIARSTYLIKYDPDGAKLWGVSIAGAATPTAITTDDAGNVYIAGIYADEVVFGSTNGVTQSVTGIEDALWGEVVTEQGAGFIAKYSPSGVLLKVQEYKPEAFEEALIPGDFFYIQDLKFKILKLEFINSKLYASVIYTGKNESNGFSLNGSHTIVAGVFMDQYNGSIINFDTSTLAVEHIYATLSSENEQQGPVWVQNALFAISGNSLYAGFFTRGGIQNLMVNGHKETFAFPLGDNEGSGHAFARVDLSTGNLQASNSSFATERIDMKYDLLSFDYVDGMLLFSGIHKDPLVFKPEVTAQTVDVFVTALDANNMGTVKFAVNSGTTVQREFASSTVFNNHLLVACNEAATSGIFAVDLPNGTTAVYTPQEGKVLTNAVYSKDGVMLKVQNVLGATKADLATTKVSVEGEGSTNIQHPGIGKDAIISYNPAENTLYFTEPATVSVYSAVGGLVLQSVNVESLSVSDLPKGVYIALARTNEDSGKLKFIKK